MHLLNNKQPVIPIVAIDANDLLFHPAQLALASLLLFDLLKRASFLIYNTLRLCYLVSSGFASFQENVLSFASVSFITK